MKNNKLKQAIKESEYTQERLGVKIGVSGQTINNCVNGSQIHKNTRKLICKALGKTLDQIFGGE
jgi:DNA-binding XRE family transcriptional regulator